MVLGPAAVDLAPQLTGIVILKAFRKAMGTHIVIALEHGKAQQGARDSNGRKTRVGRCRKRAPVVHCG